LSYDLVDYSQGHGMPLQIYTLQTAPWHILLHVAMSIVAIGLGGYLLSRRKGTAQHKLLGKIWVALIVGVAAGSFFIQARGHLSLLHLLSVVSLVSVSLAIFGARRKLYSLHRNCMIGAYTGLVVAGLFSFLPYRMLGKLVWGG
jgi:uncharacterized membrane protein